MTTARPAVLRRARNNLDLPRWFAASAMTARADRRYFDSVRTFCMFVGYPRSGHSLVGSLIDAHPDAVVAHELDVLRLVQAGFRRSQVLSLIVRNAQRYGGRREHVYNYTVPGQWQGRFRRLEVIGDKKGGRSTRRLAESPALLGRLQRAVGVPVRFVHVQRHPLDNIATMFLRRPDLSQAPDPEAALSATVDTYTLLCDTVARVKSTVGADSMLDLRSEDLLACPAGELTRLVGFLGLDAPGDYLEACAGILYAAPNRTRDRAPWTPALRARVAALTGRFDFLGAYSADS